MSTGTLKLASLLIVIAAGGGVAWQAQQGILRPQVDSSAEDDADPDLADDADSLSDDVDLLADAVPPDDDPPPLSWREDVDNADSPTPIENPRLASLPDKFQRSTSKAKSPTPIPVRTPSRNSTRTEESEADSDDPFPAEDAPSDEPTPIAMPTLLPEADDGSDPTAESSDEESTPDNSADQKESSDPFSDSGPVMLVGGGEDEEPPPRRRSPSLNSRDDVQFVPEESETKLADQLRDLDRFKRERQAAIDEAGDDAASNRTDDEGISFTDEEADPFADSAPPEFGDAPAEHAAMDETPLRDSDETPSLPTEVDSDPFGTDEPDLLLDREPISDEPAPAPARAPRRRLPALEPADDEDSLTLDAPPEEPAPVRTPRRSLPALEPVAEDESLLPEPLADEPETTEAFPELGAPSEQPPPRSNRRNRSDRDAVSDSPRSRATPFSEEKKSPPRLLPESDEPEDLHDTGFGDDPMSDGPNEAGSMDPEASPEDLDGDATVDLDAPTGLQQPRLTIEKVAPKQAVLGQPLIYSVIVKNAGSAAAHHVTVQDRIPKGTTLEGTAPRAELINKSLVWKLGTLKPNEEKKISIKVIPQEKGPIGSVAKVNFVAEIAAQIEVTAPQVQLSIDAPSQVRLGEKLKLSFTVRNSGRADASNVVLRNVIPDGLRHPAGADLEYAIGNLPAGESRDISLDLVATKNGKVENKTIITGDGGVNLEEETPVEIVGEQLLLTRTGKSKLYVDRPAIFTSTVNNEGTAPASKVTVAEVVPAGFEFVSASDQGKYDASTRAVTWTVGPIAPGEELKLSTKLMPKREGDYRATITVTGPAGSVASVDSDIKVDGFPAVAVETKSDTRLIAIGERATIRITCKNQGTSAAKNTILSASLPPELKLVDAKGPSTWAEDGNVVTFEAVPSLAPNETAKFEVEVEGLAEGDARIELQMSADHLQRPLQRDEPLRVAPEN
jgi:uncharacterized repeat protein (TIGR01451 family)